MSHVVSNKTPLNDLEIMRQVLCRFPKLHWMEGQKTHAWFGKWVGDYSKADAAYKQGINTEDYGKCEHAIRIDGCAYEIGVVRRKDGKGWSLVWDFWGVGKQISEYIGDGAEKLMVEYNRECAVQFAQSEGYMTEQTEDEENLYITSYV